VRGDTRPETLHGAGSLWRGVPKVGQASTNHSPQPRSDYTLHPRGGPGRCPTRRFWASVTDAVSSHVTHLLPEIGARFDLTTRSEYADTTESFRPG
jgi:hypothetical protein